VVNTAEYDQMKRLVAGVLARHHQRPWLGAGTTKRK
jgi:hypothetical protein